MDKEEEMDKFLERYNLSSLNQEEIENINRSIISTETDLKLLINKSPGPGGFTGEFYQTCREELTATLLKLFQKNFRERNIPKLILPIQGHRHTETKIRPRYHKKNYRPISLLNIEAKVLNRV